MATSLDELLKQSSGAPGSRSAMRELLAAELARTPLRSWKKEAVTVCAALAGLTVSTVAVLIATGNSSLEAVSLRLPSFLGLMVIGCVSAYLAFAPRPHRKLHFGLALGAVGLVGIVLARGTTGSPPTQPEWVCTLSHVGLGAGPLILALTLLRRAAPGVLRSAVAGLAVGSVGAAVGEVGCAQSWSHVLIFHCAAWLAVAGVSVLVGRLLKPRSFAP
jgi:hypothetical protein